VRKSRKISQAIYFLKELKKLSLEIHFHEEGSGLFLVKECLFLTQEIIAYPLTTRRNTRGDLNGTFEEKACGYVFSSRHNRYARGLYNF